MGKNMNNNFVGQEELEIILNEIKKKPYGKIMLYGAVGI